MQILGKQRWVKSSTLYIVILMFWHFHAFGYVVQFTITIIIHFYPLSIIQDSSKVKMKIAVRVFKWWRQYRSDIFHARYTIKFTNYNSLIHPIHETVEGSEKHVWIHCRNQKTKWSAVPTNFNLWFGVWYIFIPGREHGYQHKLMSQTL